MDSASSRRLVCSAIILVCAWQCNLVNCQGDGPSDTANDSLRVLRKVMGGLMTVGQEAANRVTSRSSANPVYDMVNNDTSLGINVLSGLVKVDRVREPGRPRALSVRVFGVPVFSRGFNRGDRMPSDMDFNPEPEADINSAKRPDGSAGGSGDGRAEEEEELPLDP